MDINTWLVAEARGKNGRLAEVRPGTGGTRSGPVSSTSTPLCP